MRTKIALLVLSLFVLCISQAGAFVVNFTGDAKADFAGFVGAPDIIADPNKDGLAGCSDGPLNQNAFNPPAPANNLIPASGFNISQVFSAYDCETDTLYIGLDVCDPRIAWDSDNNNNITTFNPALVPGSTLQSSFRDDGLEDYEIEVDVNSAACPGLADFITADFRILITSEDGGVTINPHFAPPLPPGTLTIQQTFTGADVEIKIHGVRATYPAVGNSIPVRIVTRSGATSDLSNEDVTDSCFQLACQTCIEITKLVSCSPTGPFTSSVSALRGAPVYFQIQVRNCGTNSLNNVTITDTLLSEQDNALLSCSGCTNGLNCMPTSTVAPVLTNIGTLTPGEIRTFVCTVLTNPAFPITGITPDAVNQVTVTGTGAVTGVVVNDGPETASVNLLIPSITCSKLLDDDSNFAADAGDTTPPTNNLNLPDGGNVWYQFCVNNTGETPVDFSAGADPNCPAFNDTFLEVLDPQIPGTGVNLDNLFRARLVVLFGNNILPAGQQVCVVVGPVLFDKVVLCPARSAFPDVFSACGRATGTNICLPPNGGENVSTGNCTATVRLCPPAVCIEKLVSCSPSGPFTPTVTALRGATVYFQIVVENCGGEALNNVIVTDTLLAEVDNALLSCSGCTNGLNCIPTSTGLPVQTNIGSLAIGESKTFICTALTNPAFAIPGINPDITNRVTVTATSATTQTVVNDGPSDASVNLLIPSITCSKLVADNPNMTNATQHLNLSDATMDVEQAWYRFCITNTGESAVSFAAGADPNCPKISDTFIKPGGTTSPTCSSGPIVIPETNQDLNALFLAQMPGGSLAAGQMVCVTVGPVSFDENQLCCVQKVWPDTFSACGKAMENGFCLPPGGAESVTTGNCTADVTICAPPCIQIDKLVSCLPGGPFVESVTALRGSTIYFQITVRNCGGRNLSNVTITDTMAEVDNALLSCSGCTNGLNCIPIANGAVLTNIGNLNVGESKTFICTVLTNPAFNVEGNAVDITNTVSVTGTVVSPGVGDATSVSDGPDSATVNVLVPSIVCSKLLDDDSNFAVDAGDTTPPTNDLNLSQLPIGVKQAWYQFCVENTGEVKVDFTAGANPDCPNFLDAFIETADPAIPGTGADIDTAFRTALTNAFGGQFLPAGQKVCIVVGPVTFDETTLCPHAPFVDQFSACGNATDTGICLPQSGGESVSTGICTATVRICPAQICITKGVACVPEGPFLPSATALRGADIYWQVVITNCGGKVLNNVTLTDTLFEEDNALLNCAGCTGVVPAICIPGVFNLGTMNPGDVKTIVCRFPTNPSFNVIGNAVDARNTARVTAAVANPAVGEPASVSAGPVEATVNVLVPGIECDLLMDDDDNFAEDAGDLTPPAVNLNLSMNGAPQVEHVWKQLKVCNTGEVPVNFAVGANPNCPDFDDQLVEGFGIDVAQKFRDALVAAFGSQVLPPGQCVTIVVGPLEFDENVLCPNTPIIVNRFTACGFATRNDICLPPAGGENVSTGLCQGTIMLCQPVLFQAVPGNSLGLDVHQMGHLGNSGEVISSAPGLFVLVPGNNWENFVAAAQVDQPYTLKNVTLIKQTPEFIQCPDVFPPITVQQQGTAGIRLRWPLMYEAPGTTFTLIIQYGTNSLFDDDGILGPNIPAYFHENVWEWKVEASLESMKLLLELFHQIPFGLDEVPLISDEVLYPILQEKLDMIIQLVAEDKIREASLLLGDFEMEVSDACIAVSPRLPYPTGPGTGIAGTEENPACCKLLVDAEFVGFKLGLFQATK